MELSRRSFIGAASLAIAGLALSTAGCKESEEPTPSTQESWTSEEDYDVVVVGVGCAGISACIRAAESGVKVLGIDAVEGVNGTNAISVVGIYGLGDPQYKSNHFKYLCEQSNYMFNSSFVNRYLDIIDEQVALYASKGVEIKTVSTPAERHGSGSPAVQYMYVARSAERGDQLQAMLDSYDNLTVKWRTSATSILMEDGKAVGVIAQDRDGTATRYNAKGGVIVCTGGFAANEEMCRQYMGGAWALPTGNPRNDGSGLKMLQAVGAQMGKNYAYNATEGGSLNPKAKCGRNVMLNTYNGLLRGTLMGDIVLNKHGQRFLDEAVLTKHTMMFCSEPVTREGCIFYTITSQKEIDMMKEMTLSDFCLERYGFTITNGMIKKFLAAQPVDHFDEDCEAAISEGWAWKGDTFEELEQVSGIPHIAETMKNYNKMCREGVDTEFFKDPSFLLPYENEDGPFYLVENYMGQCCTQGGVMTDANCNVLNSNYDLIEGLYAAGMDASLESVPYLVGATCHGFAVGSGCIAALEAVKRAQQ